MKFFKGGKIDSAGKMFGKRFGKGVIVGVVLDKEYDLVSHTAASLRKPSWHRRLPCRR